MIIEAIKIITDRISVTYSDANCAKAGGLPCENDNIVEVPSTLCDTQLHKGKCPRSAGHSIHIILNTKYKGVAAATIVDMSHMAHNRVIETMSVIHTINVNANANVTAVTTTTAIPATAVSTITIVASADHNA